MNSGLSAEITDTIINARAPSTRHLHPFKWRLCASWCTQCDLDPVHCPVGSILTTLKVYVAAISADHVQIRGVSVGHHPLVFCFLQGMRQLLEQTPSWDLSVILG